MRTRLAAFSLLELMVVLAIVALLFVAATPYYHGYYLRVGRNEARLLLLNATIAQEHHYLEHGRYGEDFLIESISSKNGSSRYKLNVNLANDTVRCQQALGQCYVISAHAQGAQIKDVACASFSIDQDGIKQAHNSAGLLNALCWHG